MFSCQKYFSMKVTQNDKQGTRKIKRASFSASEKGAMTAEASLVVPLFLFVLLLVLSAAEMLMIHGQVAHGLKEVVRQAAINDYVASKKGKEIQLASKEISKLGFLNSVNKKFLDHSSLVGGSAVLPFSTLISLNDQREYEATVIYTIKKELPFLPAITKTFTQKIRQKSMTGYVPKKDDSVEGTVYVTPNQSVYHTDINCTHLVLDISVDDDVEKYLSGKTKYKECEKCTKKHKDKEDISCLYVAKEGDAYHTDITCSGLKRTVYQKDKSKIKGLGPCQRCGR
ncbi:pilus assembly protein [Anaerostipes sp. MSJ-23]|uniref:pilus assembly protein n=1 Tax=unclassified Anaerostipes TaxID=2635253 RepID=UPI001C106BBC|nr:pilus assembly protein [Anaerostipes sp. MSJ-23]MBU5459917.1 pilus assembly protein [Anaerostipes sp. MSJ-23]